MSSVTIEPTLGEVLDLISSQWNTLDEDRKLEITTLLLANSVKDRATVEVLLDKLADSASYSV
jgi:hypothetical protein